MQEVKQETKKNKRRISKPVGIALFYMVCAATAVMVILHNNPLADKPTEDLKKICACALLLLACTIFGIYYDRIFIIPKELFQNRELIWKLAKNDFKKRYAGSYLGFLWALVQPVVTVVMYFIVFDVVFDTRSQMVASGVEVPYVLFLTAGLVPWFYFSEGITNGTNALLEYSYLVKKVVFKISVLPIVKVISSLFVHLFFIVFAILIFALMGKLPPVQIIQIGYYTFAVICLVVVLSYLTCSITPFFRDFGQIINVILNVGMWATPILWDTTTIPNIPNWLNSLLKLNPLYYIVQGYRDSFMNGLWFFEHPWHTLYFWAFVLMAGLISSKVFKRLRVHFSDVL